MCDQINAIKICLIKEWTWITRIGITGSKSNCFQGKGHFIFFHFKFKSCLGVRFGRGTAQKFLLKGLFLFCFVLFVFSFSKGWILIRYISKPLMRTLVQKCPLPREQVTELCGVKRWLSVRFGENNWSIILQKWSHFVHDIYMFISLFKHMNNCGVNPKSMYTITWTTWQQSSEFL